MPLAFISLFETSVITAVNVITDRRPSELRAPWNAGPQPCAYTVPTVYSALL